MKSNASASAGSVPRALRPHLMADAKWLAWLLLHQC
jgi:hypothetical protein